MPPCWQWCANGCNNSQQCAITCNKVCKRTTATCNIQQCCVRVRAGLYIVWTPYFYLNKAWRSDSKKLIKGWRAKKRTQREKRLRMACVTDWRNIFLELDFLSFSLFFVFKRINNDRLSVSREQNAANPAYQRYQGQHLQQSCMENPKDGLADWFVIKHSKDQALSLDLLSKYGFVAEDATQVGIGNN